MKEALQQLAAGEGLTREQAAAAFELIMTGQASPAQTAAMLAFLAARPPTVEEITGAATVMRQKVAAVEVPNGLTAVDTCGTGGDHAGTFNISTAAALVAAAAGRPAKMAIAKHGNKSVTSTSGSSTVLEELGVKLAVSPQTLTKCLDEAGICFCFAPRHHPAMKFAAPIRAELGFRTIFNILGPLTNPAGARRQVMGVFDASLTEPLAQVLANLGAEHAMVVHGSFNGGGIDEISTLGPTRISTAKDNRVSTDEIDPATLGLAPATAEAMRVDSPQASASIIRCVLNGEKNAARDIVLVNAAAALVVGGVATDLTAGMGLAAAAVDEGQAKATLETLSSITQADPT